MKKGEGETPGEAYTENIKSMKSAKKLLKHKKAPKSTTKHQKAQQLEGRGGGANTEEFLKAPKSTKSTKKHGYWGGQEESTTNTKETDKAQRSTKKHERSCFLVLCCALSSTQIHTNHEKEPKSTKSTKMHGF